MAEINFDDIERVIKSNKKVSNQVDIGDIKAKVISWLMRNGNIKKLAVVLIILLGTGLVNIILGVIHNTYHLRTFLLSIITGVLIVYIDKNYLNSILRKSAVFIIFKILYLKVFIGIINILLYIGKLFKRNKKKQK